VAKSSAFPTLLSGFFCLNEEANGGWPGAEAVDMERRYNAHDVDARAPGRGKGGHERWLVFRRRRRGEPTDNVVSPMGFLGSVKTNERVRLCQDE
jgi:hypothetical protein